MAAHFFGSLSAFLCHGDKFVPSVPGARASSCRPAEQEPAVPNLAYTTLDVFTSVRFEGNPLAVITDAEVLGTDEMQKIAAEFGYSEITFVLPPSDPANTAHVRIFTPTMEVPFAGHPNVGTAYFIGQQSEIFGKPVGDKLRFEEAAGIVEVDLRRQNGEVTAATIRAPKPLQTGAAIARTDIARCIAIRPEQIATANHQPLFVSVGLEFAVAELANLDALAAAVPNPALFREAAGNRNEDNHDFSLFLYVRSKEDPWHLRARMFAPLDNVAEDPATGSASAALSAYLVSRAPGNDCVQRVTIEQGVEMGRRSIIEVDVTKAGGTVTDVRISGSCVLVMHGEILG